MPCQDRGIQDVHDVVGGLGSTHTCIIQRTTVVGGVAKRKDISTVLLETLSAFKNAAAAGTTALIVYSLSEVFYVYSFSPMRCPNLISHSLLYS